MFVSNERQLLLIDEIGLILECLPRYVPFDEGRFEDAEIDCTEAIALDDRYTKAYARRGTARRELKKYVAAVEGACNFENLIHFW